MYLFIYLFFHLFFTGYYIVQNILHSTPLTQRVWFGYSDLYYF